MPTAARMSHLVRTAIARKLHVERHGLLPAKDETLRKLKSAMSKQDLAVYRREIRTINRER